MLRSLTFSLALTLGLATSAPILAQEGPGREFAAFAQRLGHEAQARSRDAAQRPAAPAEPLDIEEPFTFELDQFSVEALMLSRQIDAAGGPVDLRCIFRGMSEDAERRFNALNDAETAAQQAHLYAGLAELMRDAAEIAPAVDSDVELDPARLPASCQAVRPG